MVINYVHSDELLIPQTLKRSNFDGHSFSIMSTFLYF